MVLWIMQVQPLLFVMDGGSYWELGGRLTEAFSVGEELKSRYVGAGAHRREQAVLG